jgi:arginine N-succinyltransferase
MHLIRPVSLDDMDDLLGLASIATFGLTTLPNDRKLLERRVRDSLRGFEKVEGERPAGESYLFVMEDTDTNKVIGTSGIVSKVGGFLPFYAYRL